MINEKEKLFHDLIDELSDQDRDIILKYINGPRGEKVNLLDYGFVRLVDFMGSDLSVVRSARVSYDAAWRAGEDKDSDHKLINYLWKNKHTTPFESVTLTFEVKAPIFVFRQWHRHRTMSYNELSARYRPICAPSLHQQFCWRRSKRTARQQDHPRRAAHIDK